MNKKIKQGFTLIELLVVVLIIGILAAVALPQYQKAVEKSKAAQALTLMKTLDQAIRSYYLANGTYPTQLDQLDVSIPFTGNTKFINNGHTDSRSNSDWVIELENSSQDVALFAMRSDGKYKGAGFTLSYIRAEEPGKQLVRCYERLSNANLIFDSSLKAGAYCEGIWHGVQKTDESSGHRVYQLP